MHNIILASSSIYRRELLSRLQIPFNTFSPEIDETPQPNESIEALVLRLSKEKAKIAANKYPKAICIGSDEVAALEGTILGKPGDHVSARNQLTKMSGRKVDFFTGVCVYAPFLSFEDCQLVRTAVKFRPLSPQTIEQYLLKEKPYFSAGSFKSESLGSALIEHFEGNDPTAIIGLPLILLCDMLRNAGVDPLQIQ